MSQAGIVVLWSNGRPVLATHRLPNEPGGLVIGRSLVEQWGDDRISARHVRLTRFQDRLVIEDLDSRNGTFLGDATRVHGVHRLRAPAVLQCGRSLFLAVEDLAPYEGRAIVERHRLAVGATLHQPCNDLDRAILDESSVAIVGPRWVGRTLARSYLAARNGGTELDATKATGPLENALAVGSHTVLLERPDRLSAEDLITLRTWLETDVRFITCVRREAELDKLPAEIVRWLAPVTIRIHEPRYDELPTVVDTAVRRADLSIHVHSSAIAELLEAAKTIDEDHLLRVLGSRLRIAHAENRATFRSGEGYDPPKSTDELQQSLREVHMAAPGWLT